MRRPLALSGLVAAIALAGCALQAPPKPDEIRQQSLPNLTLPQAWAARAELSPPVADNWIATFNDPELEALVTEALLYNADLMVAAARVEQAAGYAKAAGALIYPTVNLMARGGGKLGGDGSGINGVGLFANWELDLWGRVRSERAAGEYAYQAAVADAEFARQSIAAMAAKSWIVAIEAKLQRQLAEEISDAAQGAMALARDRLRVGIGDEYDVAVAEATYESSLDAVRQLALAEEQSLRALESLVGRYPAAALKVRTTLPAMPGDVPVGLPSELLERRPDVIAAERRVAAAFHRVGEAKAARLPRISLTAGITSISSSLFVLQNHSNPVWSLGATLLQPIFNGFALEAQVEVRTAEQKLAIAEYGRVGARAFGDVESALSSGFAAVEREAILTRAVDVNVRSLDLAKVRLRVGSGDLRGVLQQGATLGASRATRLRMASEQLIQRINLHLALGGSFEPRPVPVAASGGPSAP